MPTSHAFIPLEIPTTPKHAITALTLSHFTSTFRASWDPRITLWVYTYLISLPRSSDTVSRPLSTSFADSFREVVGREYFSFISVNYQLDDLTLFFGVFWYL